MDARDQPSRTTQEKEAKWFSFAEKLPPAGVAIFGHAQVTITEKQFADPKVLGLALLCRTLSNFAGVISVAKLGLVVEARILTRSCYENLFCVAGLVAKGDEFVEAMYQDDIKGIRSRGEFVLQTVVSPEDKQNDFAQRLRARLDDMKKRWPKARYLNPKDAAGQSVVEQGYLQYSQLSGDAAHPTISALKRHLLIVREAGEPVACLDVQPVQRGTEIADTVNIACNAVIGVLVGVNQLVEAKEAQEAVRLVFDEHGVLSGAAPEQAAPVA